MHKKQVFKTQTDKFQELPKNPKIFKMFFGFLKHDIYYPFIFICKIK